MKTLYLTDCSSNIVVDKDTDFVGTLPTEDRYDIRSIYYIEEPMHVVYNCGEYKEEIDARKGDILLLFYSNRFNKYHLDTIKSKQWSTNIKNRRAIEQKEKEEWAAKNANQCECCDCCECCDICKEAAPLPEVETPKNSLVGKLKKMVKKAKKA